MEWDKDIMNKTAADAPMTKEQLETKLDSISQELHGDIRYHEDMMEQYLGDVSRGIDQTGNLEFHLNAMKEAFEKLHDAEQDTKWAIEDLEEEEEERRQEQSKE